MKYLVINSVAGFGSTGRLAAQTCRELMEQGNTCVLAFGREESSCADVPTVRIGSPWDCRIHALKSRILDDQGFESRAATRRFLTWVREYDPDVIWLHNLHGYYLHIGELFEYLRTCGKEIRWTLHDCWSFTGHCAYFDFVGCDKWKRQCCHCPQLRSYPRSLLLDGSRRNFRRKKELFTGIPNLTLIVPSHWLESRVKQSFLGDYPVRVEYNRIDEGVFHPTPGNFREKYGLEDKKIVLGVASVWDARKGLADFVELSALLDERFQIVLVGLRENQRKGLPGNILALPRTATAEELAEIYTAADVFVNPSAEETFGMTTLEARSCGTEAVVYQGTACEEIVRQFGGVAVPPGAQQLLRAVLSITEESQV